MDYITLMSLIGYCPTAVPLPLTLNDMPDCIHSSNLERQMGGSGCAPKDWKELIEKSDLKEITDFEVEECGFFARRKAINSVKKAGKIIGAPFIFVEESGRREPGYSYDVLGDCYENPFIIKGKFYSLD